MTFCSIDIIQRPSTLATTQEILRNLTREYLEETMQGGFLIRFKNMSQSIKGITWNKNRYMFFKNRKK